METIELPAIKIFFCNINTEMNLSGHCHYAEVILKFKTIGKIGFPSFKDTSDELINHVTSLKLKGFKGTNEDLLRYIHNEVKNFHFNACKKYKGEFKLHSTKLKVMGVEDENNHSNGFTIYEKYED